MAVYPCARIPDNGMLVNTGSAGLSAQGTSQIVQTHNKQVNGGGVF